MVLQQPCREMQLRSNQYHWPGLTDPHSLTKQPQPTIEVLLPVTESQTVTVSAFDGEDGLQLIEQELTNDQTCLRPGEGKSDELDARKRLQGATDAMSKSADELCPGPVTANSQRLASCRVVCCSILAWPVGAYFQPMRQLTNGGTLSHKNIPPPPNHQGGDNIEGLLIRFTVSFPHAPCGRSYPIYPRD